MGEDIGLKKIVITGPESTGKTTLSESLALKLNAETKDNTKWNIKNFSP